jgi:hypothetical protein
MKEVAQMTRHREMKRAAVTVAVAMALCMLSSPSGAGAIWGGGRRVTLASPARAQDRAGWRLRDARQTGARPSLEARAGWGLVARALAARAGW